MMGNSLWYLVRQSDVISQCVLLILLAMSILSWAIFIYKISTLYSKKKQIRMALGQLQSIQTADELVVVATAHTNTVAGTLLSKNLLFLKSLLHTREHTNTQDQLEYYLNQTIDDVVHDEESYISFLSTSATVSPLLGLFGTVWGLVHAFIRISQMQTADIAVVAPGIAEALITTLAGLMVAIPALAMYNYLIARMRTFEYDVVQLAHLVGQRMQQLLIR